MEPVEWNVVVNGAWNRAILTPAWIAQVVLGVPQGSALDVMVPLDAFAPFQVRHSGLIVTPIPGQLLVQPEVPSAEMLSTAMAAMKRAIEDLPRTPLRACGINIRFRCSEPGEKLVERTRCQSETQLSANGYEIRLRRRGETMDFKDGTLNFIADIPTTGPTLITFNFDRQCATHHDALAWLDIPASEYVNAASKVLSLITE
jgi:hypothetical protein